MSADPFVFCVRVPDEAHGARVDRFVVERLPDTSRSYVQRLIEAGEVTINGAATRPSAKVVAGDELIVRVPPPDPNTALTPADIPVPIVFEDDNVLVFDKPAGLVVHPAPGHEHGTLVNALRWIRPNVGEPDEERPGIVHRLDKDTSGLIVVAKNEAARLSLLQQWQRRDVVKAYTALVVGHLAEPSATVDAPIGRDPHNRKRMAVIRNGRPAITHLRTHTRYRDFELLDVTIETGRTHQIRVHCAFVGHPVAGDALYGGHARGIPLKRQFLHARYLRFELPNGDSLELEAPLPPDLTTVLKQLEDSA